MNGYPNWLINSRSYTIYPTSLESMSSVLSDDTSNDGQQTDRDTTKKLTSKKSPVELPYIKECRNRSGESSNNMTFWPFSSLCQFFG